MNGVKAFVIAVFVHFLIEKRENCPIDAFNITKLKFNFKQGFEVKTLFNIKSCLLNHLKKCYCF